MAIPLRETCIHKLLVLFSDAQMAFCDLKTILRSAQLHVALRQFGDRRERNAVAVLHGSQGVGVGGFYGPPNATEQVQLP